MNFDLTPEQHQMRDAIERVCAPFDADYWLRRDRAWIPRLAPVSPQLILCYIAEKVLGLPKSY